MEFFTFMQAMKLGSVLTTGCTLVLKTAEQTPLSALRVGQLIMQAGFPNGVVNIISVFGLTTGRALVTHPQIDKISFTGSKQVGYQIIKNSLTPNLKRITLQLGGKSPNIIIDDADLDLAIKQSQMAIFLNQGQYFIAGSRLFVHEKIYDEFVQKSVEAAQKREIGDPFNEKTTQSPQIDKIQRDKILSYIQKGKYQGAKLFTGGNTVEIKDILYNQQSLLMQKIKWQLLKNRSLVLQCLFQSSKQSIRQFKLRVGTVYVNFFLCF